MPFEPRKHQRELQRICLDIAESRSRVSRICAAVAPGGGKGSFPPIAASILVPRVVDKIAVVVPRDALRTQCEEAFHNSGVRKFYGHTHEIRATTSELDPSRGLVGFCTTYQAIVQPGARALLDDMRRHRYALFLDEFHHADVDSSYHCALLPFVERASLLFLLSGSLERGDRSPIAFLPYRGTGRDLVVDSDNTEATRWVNYSIADALGEHAIIPIEFKHVDGAASWCDADGVIQTASSLKDDDDALFAALSTGYALRLLDDCCSDFEARKRLNNRAKLLVVCANQAQARDVLAHLRSRGVIAKIAVQDETNSKANISEFKHGKLEVLVTVQMAYEGLDVPSATHLVCLTHIRSAPWILQMLARIWRYDASAGPWESQDCVAFVPDDRKMCEVIEYIKGEMNRARERATDGVGGGGDKPPEREPIVPLASEATAARVTNWDGETMSVEEHIEAQEFAKQFGLDGISALKVRAMKEWLSRREDARQVSPVENQAPSATPSQREKRLRDQIKNHLARYEYERNLEHGACNKELFIRFGKSRTDMTEKELAAVWAHILKAYPLHEGQRRSEI